MSLSHEKTRNGYDIALGISGIAGVQDDIFERLRGTSYNLYLMLVPPNLLKAPKGPPSSPDDMS